MGDDELDSLVVEHLSNLSEILANNHHLESALSNGRFLLAKTRQNMQGNGSRISSAAYNLTEMSTRGATTRVNVVTDSPPSLRKENEELLFSSTPRFEMVDELKDDALHHALSADPIRWFAGVLVPTTLRQAQASFRRAVHIALELASQRAKLEESSRRLTEIIAKRERLDSELHVSKSLELPETTLSNS
ncbi:hypothetical protein FBUS_10536 [Fasciolopsis buskii]|uniref:Vacuolar ATPase assembly protein VMA22 n=1 Tax=Fasciolopsis buskii TaxID=27845 RepID=A0A8E0RXD4_9TREM|nr:hypothetical protein FBUS_10536 [Fasciolopsis buski]